MTKDEARGLGWFLGFLIVTAAAVGLAQLSGCAASQREKTINTTFSSVDAACKAFTDYDLVHQKALLTAAKDKATFNTEIAKWRSEQVKIEQLCAGAYRAVAVAANVNNEQNLASLVRAALIVYQELKSLGINLGGIVSGL